MISSDKADQGKQGVSWSGSARKGSPGDWTGVMRYQVNFANTTALELWPYSNGAIYDGAPLEEFYCSTWVTPEEPLGRIRHLRQDGRRLHPQLQGSRLLGPDDQRDGFPDAPSSLPRITIAGRAVPMWGMRSPARWPI